MATKEEETPPENIEPKSFFNIQYGLFLLSVNDGKKDILCHIINMIYSDK